MCVYGTVTFVHEAINPLVSCDEEEEAEEGGGGGGGGREGEKKKKKEDNSITEKQTFNKAN